MEKEKKKTKKNKEEKEWPDLTADDRAKMHALAEGIYFAIMKAMEKSMGGPVRVRKVIDKKYPPGDKRKGGMDIIIERVPPNEIESNRRREERILKQIRKESAAKIAVLREKEMKKKKEQEWREITKGDRKRGHDAAIKAGRALRERMHKRMEEAEEKARKITKRPRRKKKTNQRVTKSKRE